MVKFNHQPYEDWVLDPGILEPQQARDLQEHLQTCEYCQGIAAALHEVEQTLRSEPVLAPASGFISRWEARILEERRRSHRRQTFLAMSFSLGGAMLLLTLMIIGLLPLLTNPYDVVWMAISQASQSYAFMAGLSEALATVTRTLFRIVPPTMWIALLVAFGGLFAMWILMLQRIHASRRVVQ